jgi:hypothetical protein
MLWMQFFSPIDSFSFFRFPYRRPSCIPQGLVILYDYTILLFSLSVCLQSYAVLLYQLVTMEKGTDSFIGHEGDGLPRHDAK